MESLERELMLRTLEEAKHNWTDVARRLSLTFRACRYRAESLVINGKTGAGRKVPGRRPLGPHWPKLRMDALRMYGNKCQCCGAGPKDGAVLHVDHIKARHLFPALEFNLDNLQVLCSTCHNSKGIADLTDWR